MLRFQMLHGILMYVVKIYFILCGIWELNFNYKYRKNSNIAHSLNSLPVALILPPDGEIFERNRMFSVSE